MLAQTGVYEGACTTGVAPASCERDGSLHCGAPIEVTARVPADVLGQRQRLFDPSPATVTVHWIKVPAPGRSILCTPHATRPYVPWALVLQRHRAPQ